jgi:hypothetical protein
MDEDGEDDASAGRGEGGADAPAAAPARPASASAITAIVLALGDAARAGQQRSDQAVTVCGVCVCEYSVSIQYSVIFVRGNGVIHRVQKPASRG